MRREQFLIYCVLAIGMILISGCNTEQITEPIATEGLPAVVETSVMEETTATEIITESEVVEETITVTPEETALPEFPCTVAFDTDRDGNREIYIMGPDGSNPTNLTNNPADDFDPAWSPNGDQIAFVSNRETDQGDGRFIFVMNTDGSNVRQLTYENDSNSPDWSPQGLLITYTSFGDIFIIKSNFSNPEAINLTNSPEEESSSSWSPDGNKLAWLVGPVDSRQIVVMDMETGATTQVTNSGKVYDVAWSVDGRLFTHWENNEHGFFNCIMQADGSELMDAGGKGTIQEFLPFWTADGNKVELISSEGSNGNSEILLVSEIFPDWFFSLTNNPANDLNPDWPANCGPH